VFVSALAAPGSDVDAEYIAMEKTLEACEIGFTVIQCGLLAESVAALAVDGATLYGLQGARASGVCIRDVGRAAAQVLAQPWLFEGAKLAITGPEAAEWEDVAYALGLALRREMHAKELPANELAAVVEAHCGSRVVASAFVAQAQACGEPSPTLGHLVVDPAHWRKAFADADL